MKRYIMKILVIDVAAETGGAIAVLEQFINKFAANSENSYTVVLSKPRYSDRKNIRFINFEWTKKSYLHRLLFDNFYIRRLIKKERPDRILSLQNSAVYSCGLPQEVYFHNALFISERRYSLKESVTLWLYQNPMCFIVKKSLKRAERIYVQAEWIKDALSYKWKIERDRIVVDKIKTDSAKNGICNYSGNTGGRLFYPANGALYKNHLTLIKACRDIWDEFGKNCGLSLALTVRKDDLNKECRDCLESGEYPVEFTGYLSKKEMEMRYRESTLVFPSVIETAGLPLAEAASFGCDIIASDLPYAREMLSRYKNVVFFDSENAGELKRIIVKKFDIK